MRFISLILAGSCKEKTGIIRERKKTSRREEKGTVLISCFFTSLCTFFKGETKALDIPIPNPS